ncbi:MAG: RNA polymerase sigma factor [Pyrinomonadaceae bacterium]|nr:RNA polymerase sigma factor [Pyrinomonadaceae bacterium]
MDQVILKRIADGDKSAVQECLDKYGGLVWSLARKMCRNSADAEDAVQEIFIDVWKNAGRYDESQASETTFIAMIARRRLIDRLRKVTRQPEIDSLDDSIFEPSGGSDNILVTIEAKEAAKAMKDLRPDQKKVIYLSVVQGCSHQEISDALNMPLGTVKTNIRRGLMQVREVLGNQQGATA